MAPSFGNVGVSFHSGPHACNQESRARHHPDTCDSHDTPIGKFCDDPHERSQPLHTEGHTGVVNPQARVPVAVQKGPFSRACIRVSTVYIPPKDMTKPPLHRERSTYRAYRTAHPPKRTLLSGIIPPYVIRSKKEGTRHGQWDDSRAASTEQEEDNRRQPVGKALLRFARLRPSQPGPLAFAPPRNFL